MKHTWQRAGWVLLLVWWAAGCTVRVEPPEPPPSQQAGPAPAPPTEPVEETVPVPEQDVEYEAPSAPLPVVPPDRTSAGSAARTMDLIVFGDEPSEQAHGLVAGWGPLTPLSWVGSWTPPSDPSLTGPSDVITGAFGQVARRLLPRTPNPDVYGGETTFAMAVNPQQQNYFTMKWWGSDPSGGRWFILNVNGLELGQRHGGDAGGPPMFNNIDMRWAPNRFIYRTVGLPFHLTRGQTSVTIRVRSLGWLNDYDPNQYFGAYQKLMKEPSMAMYRAYTHVGSLIDTSGEQHGRAPELKTPRTLENETNFLASVKGAVNGRFARLARANPDSLKIDDVRFLAECLDARENLAQRWIEYPEGINEAALVRQIVDGVDAQARRQSGDANYVGSHGNPSWGGAFGPLGDAIRLAWSRIGNGPTMSLEVDYGGSYGKVARRTAWSKMLRTSVDWGRYGRRVLANQEMYCAENIYRANRGLLLVDPSNALLEKEALVYLKEAAGILPFRGNDQKGGGPVPVRGTGEPYPWTVFTSKGLSKEFGGFVGSDYGELAGDFYHLALLSGDRSIHERTLQMFRARAIFRFPGPDEQGFLVMQAPNPIGGRNMTLPGHFAYLGRQGEFHVAAQGATVIGRDLLGYYQQAADEGNLFRLAMNRPDPYLPMRYEAARGLPRTNVRLPMSVGAPDFAWVDEEVMVVAAKHGEERLFVNMLGINGRARIFHLTDELVHFADVQLEDIRYKPSGRFTVLGSRVEGFDRAQPPDGPIGAGSGQLVPVAMRSDLDQVTANNPDGARGTGYTLRYGHWLVGVNAHHNDGYAVRVPSNFTSATDLVSGRTFTGKVVIPAKSSVVFYLPDLGDPRPRPARPYWIRALPGPQRVALTWSPTPLATHYNLKRATAPRGPYTVIAANLDATEFVDQPPVRAQKYYYIVSGVSANGEGPSSAPATPEWPSGLQNRAPLGKATASSEHPWQSAVRINDGDPGSTWFNQGGEDSWVQIEFAQGLEWIVTKYALTTGGTLTGRDPMTWSLEGSEDGSAWITLDRQTGRTFAKREEKLAYSFTNATAYRYYRLHITDNAGRGQEGLQLFELELHADPATMAVPVP